VSLPKPSIILPCGCCANWTLSGYVVDDPRHAPHRSARQREITRARIQSARESYKRNTAPYANYRPFSLLRKADHTDE
jgi:hypothetical protein